MISFLTRMYSVFLGFDSEYAIGELGSVFLIGRLLRIFADMVARICSLRSPEVANAPWRSMRSGSAAAAVATAVPASALLRAFAVTVSTGVLTWVCRLISLCTDE